MSDLQYAKEVIFHPFDAFYELKYRGKGSVNVALFLFIALGLASVLNAELSGFVVNTFKKSELNSLVFFFGIILPYLFFVIGNYSITTLMDGKGTFGEIFTVVGYSLLPNVILMVAATILSRFITVDEISFYVLLLSIGNLATIFLIFIGLVVTHEYTFFRTIVSLLLSFIAIALIIFILLLMITLFNQLYGFIKIVIMEIQN